MATPATTPTPAPSLTSFATASSLDILPVFSTELRDYHASLSQGLIEPRPYDYWGKDTPEQKARWDRWLLPIRREFYPVDWDSPWTGRGSKSFSSSFSSSSFNRFNRGGVLCNADKVLVARKSRRIMERPNMHGPLNEILVMDVDSESGQATCRVEDDLFFQMKQERRSKRKRRSTLGAINELYQRSKQQIVSFTELRRMTTSLRGRWNTSSSATSDSDDNL